MCVYNCHFFGPVLLCGYFSPATTNYFCSILMFDYNYLSPHRFSWVSLKYTNCAPVVLIPFTGFGTFLCSRPLRMPQRPPFASFFFVGLHYTPQVESVVNLSFFTSPIATLSQLSSISRPCLRQTCFKRPFFIRW